MNDASTTISEIKQKIHTFVSEREWTQYHSAKNLSAAITGEAAELMEIFRWMTDKESTEAMHGKKAANIRHEIADVMYMLLCLCNAYDIDLSKAIEEKMLINAQHYPVEKAKGNTKKYTDL
jgi:NTP pyrophosphatase (non-canonical NTP hydrolase)